MSDVTRSRLAYPVAVGPAPDECCKRCRFWLPMEAIPHSTLGGCRRHSPSRHWRYSVSARDQYGMPNLNGRSMQFDSNWPLTAEDDWCGDFDGER